MGRPTTTRSELAPRTTSGPSPNQAHHHWRRRHEASIGRAGQARGPNGVHRSRGDATSDIATFAVYHAAFSLWPRVSLETLPASASLIVLHSCPFVRFMTANHATCRRSKYAMMSGEMARSTPNHSAFEAAFSIRCRNRCQSKKNGGASNNSFHCSLQG